MSKFINRPQKMAGRRGLEKVEVPLFTSEGFWIQVRDMDYFLSFDEYPFFRDVSLEELEYVYIDCNDHLRWDWLDIDLSIETIEGVAKHPEQYPLRLQHPPTRKKTII